MPIMEGNHTQSVNSPQVMPASSRQSPRGIQASSGRIEMTRQRAQFDKESVMRIMSKKSGIMALLVMGAMPIATSLSAQQQDAPKPDITVTGEPAPDPPR
jgi:hypothetical protein